MSNIECLYKKLKDMFAAQAFLDKKVFAKAGLDTYPSDYQYVMAIVDEIGELTHELKGDWCWWKKSQSKPDRERVLEELVDVYHFIVSLTLKSIDKEKTNEFINSLTDTITGVEEYGTGEQITAFLAPMLFALEAYRFSYDEDNLNWVWEQLISVTNSLGIKFNDVYVAYFKKNQVNVERANSDY